MADSDTDPMAFLAEMISVAREVHVLSLEKVAAAAEIPVSGLLALESGDLSGLSAADLLRVVAACRMTLVPAPAGRVDDVRILLEEEGYYAREGAPSPLRKFGHLLD